MKQNNDAYAQATLFLRDVEIKDWVNGARHVSPAHASAFLESNVLRRVDSPEERQRQLEAVAIIAERSRREGFDALNGVGASLSTHGLDTRNVPLLRHLASAAGNPQDKAALLANLIVAYEIPGRNLALEIDRFMWPLRKEADLSFPIPWKPASGGGICLSLSPGGITLKEYFKRKDKVPKICETFRREGVRMREDLHRATTAFEERKRQVLQK